MPCPDMAALPSDGKKAALRSLRRLQLGLPADHLPNPRSVRDPGSQGVKQEHTPRTGEAPHIISIQKRTINLWTVKNEIASSFFGRVVDTQLGPKYPCFQAGGRGGSSPHPGPLPFGRQGLLKWRQRGRSETVCVSMRGESSAPQACNTVHLDGFLVLKGWERSLMF